MGRIDIGRKLALAPCEIEHVLVGGEHVLGAHAERHRDRGEEPRCIGVCVRIAASLLRNERALGPERLTVLAPEAIQRPAGQLLARVPFALTEVYEPGGGIACLQLPEELHGQAPLVFAQRLGIPLRCAGILARHERRFPAHGETHVAGLELRVDAFARGIDGRPLRLRVRFRDSRCFPDARDAHRILERRLARIDTA